MDAIEILIDTANNKTPRNNGYQHGDHQFWFVPVVDKHNTYLGRWKRNNEITETQYDLKHPSFTKKTESGYILEAMIPIEFIDDFKAEKGQKLGFSFLLQSPGSKGKSQSYWPLPKASGVVFNPQLWGELILN